MDWTVLTQVTGKRTALVNMVMSVLILSNEGKILEQMRN